MSEDKAEKPMPEKEAKPELTPAMAGWLVQKLDCAVELTSHEERNNFAACINRLVAIANWKEEA